MKTKGNNYSDAGDYENAMKCCQVVGHLFA